MHVLELLHKTFQKELSFVHKRTLQNLIDASRALIKSKVLSLTALGRNFPKKIQARSRIKKMDRLLGNKDLHKDSVSFYQVMNSYLVQEGSRPWIHVDWSCISSVTKMYLLRASLSMKGRAIVIYEECHPKSKENNHATHKIFLSNLKNILTPSVKPVIVTDAGFRAPWFAYVRALGWDFVGRVKNKNSIKLSHHTAWISSKELYNIPSTTPVCLGEGLLTQKEELPVHFVLFKGTSKKKRIYKSRSRRSGHRVRYVQSHKEPWLLVTSITTEDCAKNVVNIYRQRMRIEEHFRDTKCTRYGFGLKESRSRTPDRMKILVLIAAIATFACWIAGLFIIEKGRHASFQAQSSKYNGVLSIVYLGREALRDGVNIGIRQFKYILQKLYEINHEAQREVALHE